MYSRGSHQSCGRSRIAGSLPRFPVKLLYTITHCTHLHTGIQQDMPEQWEKAGQKFWLILSYVFSCKCHWQPSDTMLFERFVDCCLDIWQTGLATGQKRRCAAFIFMEPDVSTITLTLFSIFIIVNESHIQPETNNMFVISQCDMSNTRTKR